MAYTDSQKLFYNTKPVLSQLYTTMTFENPIAGKVRLLAAGKNGPYKDMMLNENGTMQLFKVVAAEVPKVAAQDPLSNDVGQIKLGRVASQISAYLNKIIKNNKTFDDKVIKIKLAEYEQPNAEPVYSIDVFCGIQGVSIGASDVVIKMQYSNPAKTRNAAFYSPLIFKALSYG